MWEGTIAFLLGWVGLPLPIREQLDAMEKHEVLTQMVIWKKKTSTFPPHHSWLLFILKWMSNSFKKFKQLVPGREENVGRGEMWNHRRGRPFVLEHSDQSDLLSLLLGYSWETRRLAWGQGRDNVRVWKEGRRGVCKKKKKKEMLDYRANPSNFNFSLILSGAGFVWFHLDPLVSRGFYFLVQLGPSGIIGVLWNLP